eukprot:6633017-Prymnesium_polylepis.1
MGGGRSVGGALTRRTQRRRVVRLHGSVVASIVERRLVRELQRAHSRALGRRQIGDPLCEQTDAAHADTAPAVFVRGARGLVHTAAAPRNGADRDAVCEGERRRAVDAVGNACGVARQRMHVDHGGDAPCRQLREHRREVVEAPGGEALVVEAVFERRGATYRWVDDPVADGDAHAAPGRGTRTASGWGGWAGAENAPAATQRT